MIKFYSDHDIEKTRQIDVVGVTVLRNDQKLRLFFKNCFVWMDMS